MGSFLRSILLIVILGAIGFAGFLFVRNGGLLPVEIGVAEQGPFLFVFKRHTGPYHTILPDLEAVESWAREHRIPCPRTFGEFIDDPNVVEAERLQSNVGCIVDQPVAPDLLQAAGLGSHSQEARRFVVAKFRGSPALGPYKVYHRAEALKREQRLEGDGPIIEIYDVKGDDIETTYLFPIK